MSYNHIRTGTNNFTAQSLEAEVEISVFKPLIVTDMALVFITPKPTKARLTRLGAAIGGGVVGTLLAQKVLPESYDEIEKSGLLNLSNGKPVPPLSQMKHMTNCYPIEVPKELAGHRAWPRIPETRLLTIIPRGIVDTVRLSWTGQMTIKVLDIEPGINKSINFWQVSKAKSRLRNAGYRLE